jgi:hypothetical protein
LCCHRPAPPCPAGSGQRNKQSGNPAQRQKMLSQKFIRISTLPTNNNSLSGMDCCSTLRCCWQVSAENIAHTSLPGYSINTSTMPHGSLLRAISQISHSIPN